MTATFAAVFVLLVAAALLPCPEAQQDFTTSQIPNPFQQGDRYPDRDEVVVCRPIEDHIDRNSARFNNELVTNTNNARILFATADSRIMSSRLLSRLNTLASRYFDDTNGNRLTVLKAWTESNDAEVSDIRSLHFEGRTVRVSVPANRRSLLLTLAVNSGFDWVSYVNQNYVRLSVIPNSCERNVDMVFMLDQSGSVGPSNHDIAIQFIRNVVSFFNIGLDSTRIALIAFSTNAFLEFDLNDYTTLTSLQQAITDVDYRGGWTVTALALNIANNVLNPSNNFGARPDSAGIPKIAVLLTDGKSNQLSIVGPANNLKNAGVTVYTVGIGNSDLGELRFISSDPDDDHVFILNSFNDAAGFVDFLSVTTCEASAIVAPCLTATLEVPEDSLAYFQTSCPAFSNNIVVELADIFGESYLYCSVSESNPGPLTANTEENETPGTGRIRQCQVSPTSDRLVNIGVQGQAANNRFSLVIRDQLFTTSDVDVNRLEGDVGLVVRVSDYLRNDATATYEYSIESGNELNQFRINSGNGNIRNPASLNFDTRASYTVLVEIINVNSPCQCAQIRINIAVVQNTVDFASVGNQEIPENSVIGTDVVTLSATGGAGQIQYSITSGNVGNTFEIGSTSGLIELRSLVNFETRNSYTLTIQGASIGTSVTGSTTVQIDILDVNEPPEFVTQCARNGLCSSTIPENEAANLFVLQIQATDPDLPTLANGMLTYSLLNMDVPFTVNSGGTIRTTQPLDREAVSSYILTLRVSDQCGPGCSLSVQTFVTVTIADENDSPPFFINGPTAVDVVENSPDDSVVTEYRASDNDTGSNAAIEYSLDTTNVPFTLNAQTGILTVDGMIDFEADMSFTIVVTARNPGSTQSASITTVITVIDQNDNAPILENEPFSISVVEHSPVDGSPVLTISATDRDSGENGRVSYLINGGNFEGSFSINAATGAIAVARDIDRERVTSFTLSVVARDNGSPNRMRTSSTVAITITDINDNRPIFNPSAYSVSLREDVATNTEVITVFAFDQDEPGNANSQIQYSIAGGNTGNLFEIGQDSGVISLTGTLDFEDTSSFSLSLLASDLGSPQMSGSAMAAIQVLNVNEQPPSISGNQAVNVSELAPVNSVIAQFEGADPDGMTVTFSITVGNEEMKFEIGASTGTITLVDSLDFETTPEYLLDVSASDSEQTTTVTLTVSVLDENEFTPVFNGPSNFQILEEQPDDSTVGEVSATDDDGGPINSAITFTFLLQQSQITEYIRLNPTTGRLSTIGVLDREVLEQLFPPSTSQASFDVVARDNGNPSLQAVRTYTITLMDINDNRPIFAEDSYENSLRENLDPPMEVFQVSASDQDIGNNGEVRYFFSLVENLGNSNPFSINEETGLVTMDESLDCEVQPLYNFTITARDMGNPQMSSQVNAVLNLIDENDNSPIFIANVNDVNAVEFSEGTYATSVRENSFPGTTVLQVLATDADKEMNGEVEYSISSSIDISASMIENAFGVTIFRINSVTGEVFHSTPFDFESASEVNLTVVATDSGIPRRSATANITVSVDNIDESAPRFIDSCNVNVPEDTPANEVITQCIATDPDNIVGNPNAVMYSITSGNQLGRFAIDENTGEIRITEQLDRENIGLYTLFVTARDSVGLSAGQQARITVTDVNDNTPTFIGAPYEFFFSNNLIRSYRRDILTVQARDGDVGSSGSFSFSLNARKGALETILDITVTDGGSDPLSSTTTVTVLFEQQCILQSYAIGETSGQITADVLCSVEINPSEQAVTIGQDGEFTCDILRNSRVTYHWLLDGRPRTTPNVLAQSQSQAGFTVAGFQRTDVGNYACLASSQAGSLQTTESVTTFQEVPVITLPPEDFPVKLGEDASFRCLAVGVPDPVIEWYFSSQLIERGSSVLVVEDVGRRNEGDYFCLATSVAGNTPAARPASLIIYEDGNVVDLMIGGLNSPNEDGTCHYFNGDDFTSTLDQVLGRQGLATQVTNVQGSLVCPESPCGPNPCSNGGTCQPSEEQRGGYECLCPNGFTGNECELDVDECIENPCGDGATCENTQGLYRCLCLPSRTGHRCQFQVTCPNITCNESTQCVELLENGASACLARPSRTTSVIVTGLRVTDPGFLNDLVQTFIEQQLSIVSRKRRRKRQQDSSSSSLTTACEPRFTPLPQQEDTFALLWICPQGEEEPTANQVAALCNVLLEAGAVETCQSPGREQMMLPAPPTLEDASLVISIIQVDEDSPVDGDSLANSIADRQTELASATGLTIEDIVAEPVTNDEGSNTSVVAGVVVAVIASVILLILLVLGIVAAVWMKKNHHKKQEAKRRHALEMACLESVPTTSPENTYTTTTNGSQVNQSTNYHTTSTTMLIDGDKDTNVYDTLPPRNGHTSAEPEDLYVNTAALRKEND